MTKQIISILILLPLLAALALLTACSKQGEPAAHSENDGHGQEKTAVADHSGHAHAQAAAATKDPSGRKMCPEHNVPVEECGICRPQLAATLKTGESAKVRLASNGSAGIAGVQTATPTVGTIADSVECYAELTFNQNKLAQIAAPVGGIIQEVPVDLGSKVEEKQPVAKIWSASIAEAVAKAVLSHQTLDRERKLRADRVSSEKDLQQAEAEHRASCQQLRTLGFTEEQIDALGAKPHEQVLMEVRAPFAGEIVERFAVRGALVEARQTPVHPGRSLRHVGYAQHPGVRSG